jgi:hypothetical protein
MALLTYLLVTAHLITSVPSEELMLGRSVCSRLPDFYLQSSDILDEDIRSRYMTKRAKRQSLSEQAIKKLHPDPAMVNECLGSAAKVCSTVQGF